MAHDNAQDRAALSGQYRPVEKTADDERGGLWLGVDDITGRNVLIRVLPSDAVGEDGARPLEGLTLLRHENILPILTFRLEGDKPHVVYEGVEGKPLTAFLGEGAIPWDSACEIAAQLLEALAHIHEHGFAYGPLRPQAVWVTGDNRIVLADLGVCAALEASSSADEADAASAGGPPHDMTPQGDLAALGAFLESLIAGREAVPPGPAAFIARCHGDAAAPPFADATEARDALLEIMRRELAGAPTAAEEEEEEAPAVAPTPTPPPPPPTAAPEAEDAVARIRDLERQIKGRGRTLELEAELARLRDAHGRAQLEPIAGLKGRAVLGRHDAAGKFTVVVFVAGCALGFGLLWWIVSSSLQTMPLSDAMRTTLTYVALAAYVVVGAWIAAALLLTRVRTACYAVVSECEVLCRDEGRDMLLARLTAADVRAVELVSYDEDAPWKTIVDIETWTSGRLRLDFAARAYENGK